LVLRRGRKVITRIREVRRSRGMTLDDVARRCAPPTTPQTIGRLETGTRTLSLNWLNRIANALGVEGRDLVGGGDRAELKVAAILGDHGAVAPAKFSVVVPPRASDRGIAILVSSSVGDYRVGDEIWCETLAPENYGRALNRDILVPRPAGRFVFGRLIDRDRQKLQILPLIAGARQQVLANPPWLGLPIKLVRTL
jgi:transcriptional regulator with XRE-family HTH domain